MKLYVGLTDNNWYDFLTNSQPDEVNFWRPGGKQIFKALEPNDLFLFKLHSPLNYIVGGGFFVRHSFLPLSVAWDIFGTKNGLPDYFSFSQAIFKYRKSNQKHNFDPTIGCIILAAPFFFNKNKWIPVPEDWSPNIVQGKTYDTSTSSGMNLYYQVQERMEKINTIEIQNNQIQETNVARYGTAQIIYPRIGQSAFRVMIMEAYCRRCAISGEKTLPVLDAAHIKPISENGSYSTSNGLLLRKDLHALFDKGYLTIDENLHVKISKKIIEDYGSQEYQLFDGKKLVNIPNNKTEQPSSEFLRWHNEKFLD